MEFVEAGHVLEGGTGDFPGAADHGGHDVVSEALAASGEHFGGDAEEEGFGVEHEAVEVEGDGAGGDSFWGG